MLSSGLVVAVGLLLSNHGSEGSREDKFRGALAQASVEARGSASLLEPVDELASLRADRPGFGLSTTLLAFGGAFSVLGPVVVLLTLAFINSVGEASVWFVVLGAGLFGVGVVLGVIGGIMMAIVGEKMTRSEARFRELEEATRPQPSTQRFSVPPRLVLARF